MKMRMTFFLRGVILLISRYSQAFEKLLHSSLHSHDGCLRAGSPERLGDIQNIAVTGGGMTDGILIECIEVSPVEDVPCFSPQLTYFRSPLIQTQSTRGFISFSQISSLV